MVKKIYLSYSACPESCWHFIRAVALGQPSVLTYCSNRKIVNANRRKSTRKLSSSPLFIQSTSENYNQPQEKHMCLLPILFLSDYLCLPHFVSPISSTILIEYTRSYILLLILYISHSEFYLPCKHYNI